MNKTSLIIVITLLVGAFSSCKKEEGEGGKATIEGKLYNKLYDPNGKFLKKEEAREENVYIIYGDNDVYDDNTDSHDDGAYDFKYLRKGKYTIIAYSDCNSCPSGKESVEVDVEIKDKKEVVMAEDLEVKKNIDIDDGSGSISGWVNMTDYTFDILNPSVYPKLDQDVYIVYDNDQAYFDRTITGAGGVFKFSGLIEGSYKIYAFSDCLGCTSGVETKELLTQITVEGEAIQLPALEIDER